MSFTAGSFIAVTVSARAFPLELPLYTHYRFASAPNEGNVANGVVFIVI